MRTLKSFNLAAVGMAAVAVATLLPSAARAQDPMGEPDFTNLGSYSIAIPIGDTHRFTPGVSWFGAAWEGQWLMRPRTVAGASVTINDFYDVTHGTTNFSSGSATGLQSRDLLVVSAL